MGQHEASNSQVRLECSEDMQSLPGVKCRQGREKPGTTEALRGDGQPGNAPSPNRPKERASMSFVPPPISKHYVDRLNGIVMVFWLKEIDLFYFLTRVK